jgi:hypothetical protein
LQSYDLHDALKDLGARVQMHRDHFSEDAEDVDWLPVIAKRRWVILTKDQYNWLEPSETLTDEPFSWSEVN